MKYKQSLITVAFLSVLLVGCGESNDSTSTQTIPTTTQQQEKTTPTNNEAEQLSLLSAKGNLWLAVFEENFDAVRSKQHNQIISSMKTDLLNQSERVLKAISLDDASLNMDMFQNSDDPIKRAKSLSYKTPFQMSNWDAKTTQNIESAIQYLVDLQPAIPELDQAGKAYSDTYIELYNAMSAFRTYIVTDETYRLDDYAQLPQLHENLKTAFVNHINASNDAFQAYDVYYDDMHQKEKALVKTEGLIIHYNIMESLDLVTKASMMMRTEDLSAEGLQTILTEMETIANNLANEMTEQQLNKEYRPHDQDKVNKYIAQYKRVIIDVTVLVKNLTEQKQSQFESNYSKFDIQYQSLVRYYNDLM